MTKRLLFSAVLAAMIGANDAQAFNMALTTPPTHIVARAEAGDGITDVTVQYLKNAGFDTEADFQTGEVKTGTQTKSLLTDWAWAGSAKADAVLGASFKVGSDAKFNSASIPAKNSDNETTGGVVAFSMGWGQTSAYSQELADLPAGVYHFEYAAYNTNDQSVAQNLIGYVDGNGKTYYGTKKTFPKNQWVKETVNFEVVEGKTGKFSIGFQAIVGKGSGNSAKICLDYIKIYSGIEIPARADAEAALAQCDYAGEERTALENLIKSNPATLAEADAFNTQIIEAMKAFYSAADAASEYRKNYEAVKSSYTYNASSYLGNISNWEGNMVLNNGDQHWSGNKTGYWEQTGDMWSKDSWTVNKKTSVSLPVGKYALVAAARASSGVDGFLKVDDKTVSIPTNGDSGYGIDKDGNATNNPESSYTNNNAGRGWEWRTIEFEVTDASKPVTIEMGGSTTSLHQWMSISDIALMTTPITTPADYVEHFKAVNDTYKYDATAYLGDASTWDGTFSTNSSQHWSGDNRSYFDHWEGSAWSQSKKTTLNNLPAGKYVFIASGRGSKDAARPYIKVNDDIEYFTVKDGEGKGIDINGNATFDEAATYSNNNAGRGWEWRTIEFEVAADNDPVTLEIGAYGNANTWASICDLTLKTATDKQREINLITLANAIDEANKQVPAANIGEDAFQISQSKVMLLQDAITAAEQAKADEEKTAEELNTVTETLNAAVATYGFKTVELNKPQDGEKFNIIINGNSGYNKNGKTLTFKNNPNTSGNYSMGYSETEASFYNQTLTLIPTDETNEYILSIDEADGTKTYVGTGENYGGNAQQLRATTDRDKALAVKIEATTNDGLYNLRNTANNMLISANGENDEGFFTAGKQWNNFNLVPAKKNTATLKITDAKWATFIAPFEVTIPEGVKAYTCDATKGSTLTMTEVDGKLAANTPYILYAEAPVTEQVEGYALANKSSYSGGLLTGSFADMQVAKDAGNYVLQNHDGKVAFYKVDADGVNCIANRAYLTVQSSEAKSFSFDDSVTAINALLGNNGAVEVERYNAAGTKVSAPVKGLNIVKMSDGTIVKHIVK